MENSAELALSGDMTIDNANHILKQLLARQLDSHLSVSLADVRHCDSAGIAVLIEAKSRFAEKHNRISYVHPPKQLRDWATFLKVDHLLFH